jgi:hypothetical protein
MIIPGELVIEARNSRYPVFGGRPFLSSLIQKTMGDWRPPQVWIVNLKSGMQERLDFDAPELLETIGLRAAGMRDGVVIVAGPQANFSGLVMFAFDAISREYMGARVVPEYGDIRTFVTIGNATYTGVKTRDGHGEVLRWRGTRSAPFQFDVVARLDNDAANLTVHDNRLIVGTWANSALSGLGAPIEAISNFVNPGPHSAIWASPTLRGDGSIAANAAAWTRLWSVDDYEPDDVIAGSYGIGSMASFQGCLYWGTMNAPFAGFSALLKTHPVAVALQIDEAKRNSARLASVFRLCDIHGGPDAVELLCGESHLARFFRPRLLQPAHWQMVPNMMNGREPLYGASGFGRPATYYVWSSKVFDGKLFMGTMEHPMPGETADRRGANLWAFGDHANPASLISDNGLTTPLNEGIRNMIVVDDALYLGMTNSANISPDGGWELVRAKPEVVP